MRLLLAVLFLVAVSSTHSANVILFHNDALGHLYEDQGPMPAWVWRWGDLSIPASVGYRTVPATASTADFLGSTGRVNFPPGEEFALISVPFVNDALIEPPGFEYFEIELFDPSDGWELGFRPTFRSYINDNDKPPALVAGALTEQDNEVELHVERADDGTGPISVEVTITGGTAELGKDFSVDLPSRLEFGPGFSTQSFIIRILEDGELEPDETIHFTVISADLHTTNTTILSIADDERLPILDPRFSVELAPEVLTITGAELPKDGRMVLSGDTPYNSSVVWRVNPDGSRDTNFGRFHAAVPIADVEVDSEDRILLAMPAHANFSNRLVRLLPGGTVDPAFNFQRPPLFEADVFKVAPLPNRQVIIAGWLTNRLTSQVARLNEDGSWDDQFQVTTWSAPSNLPTNDEFYNPPEWFDPVTAIEPIPSNKLLVAGNFQVPSRTNAFGLARLNENGSIDDSFDAMEVTRGVAHLTRLPDGRFALKPNLDIWTPDRRSRARQAILTPDGNIEQLLRAEFGYYHAPISSSELLAVTSHMGLNHHYSSIALFTNGVIDSSSEMRFGAIGFQQFQLLDDGSVLVRMWTHARNALTPPLARFLPHRKELNALRFTQVNYQVSEQTPQLTLELERVGRLDLPLQARCFLRSDTAFPESDYQPLSQDLAFAPWERKKQVTIQINDDAVGECAEFFAVTAEWTPTADGPLERTSSFITVADDDEPPNLIGIQQNSSGAIEIAAEAIPGCDYALWFWRNYHSSADAFGPYKATNNVLRLTFPMEPPTGFFRIHRY